MTEKKIIKRGVGSVQGVQRKKFTVKDVQTNKLFLAHLDDVTVTQISIKEDSKGLESFRGLSIPKLNFFFSSNEKDPTKRKHVALSFNAIESNADTIPGGKYAWTVDAALNYINHMVSTLVLKGREFTEAELDKLNLPFMDFDEDNCYVSVPAEEVIAGWNTLFTNVAEMLNADNKKAYAKSILWLKLTAAYKGKQGWKNNTDGNLSFSTFVGEGVIEVYQEGVQPTISFNPVTESLEAVKEAPKQEPKMPNDMGGGVGLGMPAEGFNSIGDDLDNPF